MLLIFRPYRSGSEGFMRYPVTGPDHLDQRVEQVEIRPGHPRVLGLAAPVRAHLLVSGPVSSFSTASLNGPWKTTAFTGHLLSPCGRPPLDLATKRQRYPPAAANHVFRHGISSRAPGRPQKGTSLPAPPQSRHPGQETAAAEDQARGPGIGMAKGLSLGCRAAERDPDQRGGQPGGTRTRPPESAGRPTRTAPAITLASA